MQIVVNYLQSYQDSFWQYEESGNVISIPNGYTIGYSDMIISEMVYYLAPQGLPRFGALLLAIAATNPNAGKSIQTIKNIVGSLGPSKHGEYAVPGFGFLDLLSDLPEKFKKGKLRIEIFRSIFHNCHQSVGLKKSKQIQQAIKGELDFEDFSSILLKAPLDKEYVHNDLKVLALIGGRFNSVNDVLASLSDLPPIEYTEFIEPISDTQIEEGDLIDQLVNDPKTFHVGTLISKVISGLNIPFHSSLPSQQPLGGVADITNKGNFDKLLISEYAFDDTVLMSRLANNESLYHHREVPPADNNYHRIILLDVTIKNWGTIRTIAFATMLAIANHPKNKNPIRVFLVGRSYQEIGFETPIEIIEAMQYLDNSINAGLGLTKLFTEEKIDISEIFYIGNKETLEDTDMHLFNAEYGKRIDHWIHPTIEGNISVYKNPKRGKRFIQEFNISLSEAWNQNRNSIPLSTKEYNNTEYPILFPATKWKQILMDRGYVYIMTKEKALVRLYNLITHQTGHAWEMIKNNWSRKDFLLAVYTKDRSSAIALVRHETESSYSDKVQLWDISLNERVEVNLSGSEISRLRSFETGDGYIRCNNMLAEFHIHLDGSVTKHSLDSNKKRLPQVDYNNANKQIYKNINRVSITAKNQLRFGVQDLFVKNKHLFLQPEVAKQEGIRLSAEIGESNIFTFVDGSSIQNDRNGMLVLNSSNQDIPRIYIPSVINKSIAAATKDTFAGNSYYRKKATKKLIIKQEIADKKKVEEALHFEGFRGDKLMQHALKFGVVETDNLPVLELLHKKFEKIGIYTELLRLGTHQTEMDMEEFYQQYIQTFIDQILSYGY